MPIESSETRDSGRVRQRMPRPGDAPVCLDQLPVEDTPVQTSSSHVLVVDHDMNLCRQLSDYLGKNDFQVTAVNTGKQMLELIRRDGIDLLLLEPGLPGEDGLKLTKAIRDSSSMPLVDWPISIWRRSTHHGARARRRRLRHEALLAT